MSTPPPVGTPERYDKLTHALRAEIDEAAWSGLYSTAMWPAITI